MKNIPEELVRQKQNDLLLQLVFGAIALLAGLGTFGFGLYLLGLVHALSTLYWAIRRSPQRPLGRRILEPLNLLATLALMGTAIASYLYEEDWFLALSMAMLVIGPVLGISYILLTVREIRLYKRLSQPEAITPS